MRHIIAQNRYFWPDLKVSDMHNFGKLLETDRDSYISGGELQCIALFM